MSAGVATKGNSAMCRFANSRGARAPAVLPHGALLHRVHPAAEGAVEVPGKVLVVRQGPDDPELPGGVVVCEDQLLEGRVLVLGAPELGVADPEHLRPML